MSSPLLARPTEPALGRSTPPLGSQLTAAVPASSPSSYCQIGWVYTREGSAEAQTPGGMAPCLLERRPASGLGFPSPSHPGWADGAADREPAHTLTRPDGNNAFWSRHSRALDSDPQPGF